MTCPSCSKPASFTRVSFSLQGVSLSQSLKGYSRCEHCGQLLRVRNFNSTVMAQALAGVISVGIYALAFDTLGRWIGYMGASILFFPYLLAMGAFATYVSAAKFSNYVAVGEDELTVGRKRS